MSIASNILYVCISFREWSKSIIDALSNHLKLSNPGKILNLSKYEFVGHSMMIL